MKKTLILLTLVSFIAVTGFVNSPGSTQSKVTISSQAQFGDVPEAVQVSFIGVVTDIIDNWYPGNSGCDCSAIGWDHYKGSWVATGDVLVVGGSGGINVVSSDFKNTGEFVSLNYNVLP